MDYHKDCIFCRIANKEVDSYKIYEDDRVFVFLYNRKFILKNRKNVLTNISSG